MGRIQYLLPRLRTHRTIFPLGVALAGAIAASGPAGRAQVPMLDPVQVSATRGAPPPADMPVAVEQFDDARLQEFPAITLDDALRQDASLSLFRRAGSLISNPTSQGVSLREIGPSGASRSLVLVNGVPLNDPFGGWVLWNGAPRLSLRSAEIVQGGGSGIWGNAALAGVIELLDDPFSAAQPHGVADGEYGAFSTRSGEFVAAAAAGSLSAAVDARAFATDGFYTVLPAARGPVDRPFWSEHALGRVTLKDNLTPSVQAQVTADLFSEHRGNGTALTQNSTHSSTVSAQLDGTPAPGVAWDATAYVEREGFTALFSSVAAGRATETPSDSQFAVPASAGGAALTGEWSAANGINTSVGADFRSVVGETREDYTYVSGTATRERWAGGTEDFGGAFVHEDGPVLTDLRWSADLRLDHWELRDGHMWDYARKGATAPTALTRYPAASGTPFDPSVGWVWKFAPGWTWRASAYRGFRVPTLNEFYRPFRVGTVSTLANPALRPETLWGGETGVEYQRGPLRVRVTAFADALHDAVGTVTLSSTPALTTVQRANLDSVRVRGTEASVEWTPAAVVSFRAGYLFNDSRILSATAEPDLVGLRLQEVPRHTVTASATWHAPAAIDVTARGRWVSLQFDDASNTLRLPAAGVADVELSRKFGRRCEIYAAVENVADAKVETSLSTAGLATYDAPRLLRGGLRFGW